MTSYLVSTVDKSIAVVIRLVSLFSEESSNTNVDSIDEISIVDMLSVVTEVVLNEKRAPLSNHFTATALGY
jgi:hypothetical protein